MPTFKHPCPACGKYIARDVARCPFCGRIDPFVPGRCPTCRAPIEDLEWLACPSCGQPLREGVAPMPGATSAATAASGPAPGPEEPSGAGPLPMPAAPGEILSCTACGAPLAPGARFCTTCGQLVG